MSRIPAVDSLRIVSAFIVLGLHLSGLPIYGLVTRLTHLAPDHAGAFEALLTLNRAAFDGAAAVIVFFVISGICIHWPVRDRPLDVRAYLVRRFVRVGLPMLLAIALAFGAFGEIAFLDAVLWSLYCELIYYGLYPLLRKAADRIGWSGVLGISVVAAVLLTLRPDPYYGYFFAYGHALTWILGLPVWLLGVWIADRVDLAGQPLPRLALHGLRFGVWLAAAVAIVLHDQRMFPFKYSLLLFALPAGLWVVCEIRNGHHCGVRPAVEAAGAWSFSLYLCHKFAIHVLPLVGLEPASIEGWPVAFALALGISLLFYRLVERPSHELARRFALRVSRRNSDQLSAIRDPLVR